MRGETVRPVLPGLDPCMAAKRVLGNAIRCTKRLQSDKQGAETAEGRLLPETSRLFESASFREVGTDPGANQLEAGAETGQSGRATEGREHQLMTVETRAARTGRRQSSPGIAASGTPTNGSNTRRGREPRRQPSEASEERSNNSSGVAAPAQAPEHVMGWRTRESPGEMTETERHTK